MCSARTVKSIFNVNFRLFFVFFFSCSLLLLLLLFFFCSTIRLTDGPSDNFMNTIRTITKNKMKMNFCVTGNASIHIETVYVNKPLSIGHTNEEIAFNRTEYKIFPKWNGIFVSLNFLWNRHLIQKTFHENDGNGFIGYTHKKKWKPLKDWLTLKSVT